MSLIKIGNISAGYKKENVIENITIEIKQGELVGVLGSNGSGKSTLAKAVCNILPHSGNVILDGQMIEKLRISQIAKIISYVPQHSGIGIDISVLDVVMMGFNSSLRLFERPNKSMMDQAKTIINELGLSEKADTNYMTLSEGQKQLVVLARALVGEGRFLVMDEPESALDFNIRYRIMKIVKKWIAEKSRAGLVILHDTMLALNNCDRLVLIKNKKIVGEIDLHNDTIEAMEDKLKLIYGDIRLLKVNGENTKDNLIMVFDSEDI